MGIHPDASVTFLEWKVVDLDRLTILRTDGQFIVGQTIGLYPKRIEPCLSTERQR
jgi:hypothetical protein